MTNLNRFFRLAVVALSLLVTLPSLASFRQQQKRYLSSRDFFNLIDQKFPTTKHERQAQEPILFGNNEEMFDCKRLTNSNRSINGTLLAVIGKPASKDPGFGFVRWLTKCLPGYINSEFTDLQNQIPFQRLRWEKYFSKKLVDKYFDKDKKHPLGRLQTEMWSTLSEIEKDEAVIHVITFLIGPANVIRDLKMSKDMEDLAGQISRSLEGQQLSIFDSVKRLTYAVTLREEFYTY